MASEVGPIKAFCRARSIDSVRYRSSCTNINVFLSRDSHKADVNLCGEKRIFVKKDKALNAWVKNDDIDKFDDTPDVKREDMIPYKCNLVSKQCLKSNHLNSAHQPVFESLQIFFNKRAIIQVPQPLYSVNFYLSTGSSNWGHNFPNTFFRNKGGEISSRLIHKCSPVNDWLSALLRTCCKNEELKLFLTDTSKPSFSEVLAGSGYDKLESRWKDLTASSETHLSLCVIDDIKYDYLGLLIKPRYASDMLELIAEKGPEGYYIIELNQKWSWRRNLKVFTEDYFLSACKTIDLLLISFLNKFCTWRDVQLSSCFGGLWDVEVPGFGTTDLWKASRDLTIINLASISSLKYMVQHYDFIEGGFDERAKPLIDLTPEEKERIRQKV